MNKSYLLNTKKIESFIGESVGWKNHNLPNHLNNKKISTIVDSYCFQQLDKEEEPLIPLIEKILFYKMNPENIYITIDIGDENGIQESIFPDEDSFAKWIALKSNKKNYYHIIGDNKIVKEITKNTESKQFATEIKMLWQTDNIKNNWDNEEYILNLLKTNQINRKNQDLIPKEFFNKKENMKVVLKNAPTLIETFSIKTLNTQTFFDAFLENTIDSPPTTKGNDETIIFLLNHQIEKTIDLLFNNKRIIKPHHDDDYDDYDNKKNTTIVTKNKEEKIFFANTPLELLQFVNYEILNEDEKELLSFAKKCGDFIGNDSSIVLKLFSQFENNEDISTLLTNIISKELKKNDRVLNNLYYQLCKNTEKTIFHILDLQPLKEQPKEFIDLLITKTDLITEAPYYLKDSLKKLFNEETILYFLKNINSKPTNKKSPNIITFFSSFQEKEILTTPKILKEFILLSASSTDFPYQLRNIPITQELSDFLIQSKKHHLFNIFEKDIFKYVSQKEDIQNIISTNKNKEFYRVIPPIFKNDFDIFLSAAPLFSFLWFDEQKILKQFSKTKENCLAIVEQNHKAFEYLPKQFKSVPEIAEKVLRDKELLPYIGKNCWFSTDFTINSLKINNSFISKVPNILWDNYDFLIKFFTAVEENKIDIRHSENLIPKRIREFKNNTKDINIIDAIQTAYLKNTLSYTLPTNEEKTTKKIKI